MSQPYVPDGINSSNWVVTLSKAVFHSPIKKEKGLRNQPFGVAGVHMQLGAFVELFRQSTTLRDFLKFGCGDMGTSALADQGLACFILNENANILLDRKIMKLANQHPSALKFDPAMRDFQMEEPFITEQLMIANAIKRTSLQYGATKHVAYHINQQKLEEFSEKKRAAARSAGGRESDLIGIDLLKRVKTPNGFTLNNIWLYQVPRTKTYLLVVTGYAPLSRRYFCGSLSLYCPSVFEPMESTEVENVCNSSDILRVRRPLSAEYIYEGPSFAQLRRLHNFGAVLGSYNLRCPRVFQLWTVGLVGVLKTLPFGSI
jgi:hypothetical protein